MLLGCRLVGRQAFDDSALECLTFDLLFFLRSSVIQVDDAELVLAATFWSNREL